MIQWGAPAQARRGLGDVAAEAVMVDAEPETYFQLLTPEQLAAYEQQQTSDVDASPPSQIQSYAPDTGESLSMSEPAPIATTLESADHFVYIPPGGVREVQLRLAGWGRPLAKLDPSDPYGFSGPLFPGDFGLSTVDVDGTDDARTGLAIASFQRWWNEKNPASPIPVEPAIPGQYDLATHYALVSSSGAAVPSAPTPTTASPLPLPTSVPAPSSSSTGGATVINFPGAWQGAPAPAAPAPSAPAPSSSGGLYLVGALALAAAGTAIGVAVVRRKRKRGAR